VILDGCKLEGVSEEADTDGDKGVSKAARRCFTEHERSNPVRAMIDQTKLHNRWEIITRFICTPDKIRKNNIKSVSRTGEAHLHGGRAMVRTRAGVTGETLKRGECTRGLKSKDPR